MNFTSHRIMFMIDGGKPLELVQQHIADRIRVQTEAQALARELGCETFWADRMCGVLTAVKFPFRAPRPPDFKKPDSQGRSFPKHKTEWAKRFSAQKGYPSPVSLIHEAFGVPLSVAYKTTGGEGWTAIGSPLQECGFLWMSREGPYAMWIPDVPKYVEEFEAKGYTVEAEVKAFKPIIRGARRIHEEEWEILVAQAKLAEKKKKQHVDVGEPA